LLKAGPSDYMLAMSVASASLPVIGKHLEPLGAATAMGVWGYRHLPDFLGATAKSLVSPGNAELKRQERDSTNSVAEAAARRRGARQGPGDRMASAGTHAAAVRGCASTVRSVYRTSVVRPPPSQLLDVAPRGSACRTAPVLLFVPGGAWCTCGRLLQGYALMSHLAEGWVCLSIDYRVARTTMAGAHHRRQDRDRLGARTSTSSAATAPRCGSGMFGGHPSALAGLTANDPEMQCELLDGSDTSVDAVVGSYGRYDWEDRSTAERARFVDFLERVVVGRKIAKHPDIFRKASPIARVHADAPPFLIIHGTGDSVIPVAQARSFVERLRAASHSVVSYVELPGAGHAFDMIDGARTGSMVTAIGLFLNQIHRNRSLIKAKKVI
jgi:acetyl esterase/lipase